MGFFFKGLVGSLGDSQFAHTFYLFSQESSIARISKWTRGSGNNFYSGGGTGNSCTVQKRVWKIGAWVFYWRLGMPSEAHSFGVEHHFRCENCALSP